MNTVAIYLRVSSNDGVQTVENQRLELRQACERRGWQIVAEYKDEGISGSKGRDKRPQFDALCKDMVRGKFDIVAAWSVDRLSRSLQDLVTFLGEVHGVKADLYLHSQGLDTRTPAGKALFQMCGVFAEFERAIMVERVRAGLERARTHGTRSGRPIGGPRLPPDRVEAVRAALANGASIRSAARSCGVSVGMAHKLAVARSGEQFEGLRP